jgi:Protein of unknown function (DUF3800)
VASWRAYIDESGTHDQSLFTVTAAVIACETTWASCLPMWIKILEDYTLSAIHFTDFWSPNAKPYRHLDHDKKRECASRLIREIQDPKYDFEFVGFSIQAATFKSALKQFQDLNRGANRIKAYDLLLGCSVGDLITWGDSKPSVSTIRVFAEDGAAPNSALFNRFSMAADRGIFGKVRNISFCSKKNCHELEIADLVAYELFKYGDNVSHERNLGTRSQFEALRNGRAPIRPYIINREWASDSLNHIRAILKMKLA